MALLESRTGLIVGVANERSYAWYIAKSLAELGATCLYTHLPGEKNERRTRRAVNALGDSDPWVRPLDVTDEEQIAGTFAEVAEAAPKLDFLIHSVAFAQREYLQPGRFIDTPREAYSEAVEVSAYSLVSLSRAARPLMKAGEEGGAGGSILCMSYYGGDKVVPGYNVMGVAKAALECSARYLAAELGADGIRVNVISGGYLRTLASSAVGGTDTMLDHAATRAPLRRPVEGEDVGGTAAYLVSDLAAGVTGETIFVDCGVNTIGV